nr:MAG TPA: hypothetical protein [Caudoviricetes sp.]
MTIDIGISHSLAELFLCMGGLLFFAVPFVTLLF